MKEIITKNGLKLIMNPKAKEVKANNLNKVNTNLELLKAVDFGDIDGLYDAHINDYFIDNEYKKALLSQSKYFVIGRKGTGKSALYNWINRNQVANGNMVSNKSFNDFPFEKLLQLSDDDFAKPNQYQSVWKNIIFSEIARLLVSDQSNPIDDDLSELSSYIQHVFGSNLTDLHKEVTRKLSKSSQGLSYSGVSATSENSNEVSLYDGYKNLTRINDRLNEVIFSYLKRNNTKQYLIQFDQLDDNYTSFVNNNNYLQCIISLFKSIYQINQSFKSVEVDVKVIGYLRSDIYNLFNKFDPESARWDQYLLKLNWTIVNRNDWEDSELLKLINARISNSLNDSVKYNPFNSIFDSRLIKLNPGKNGDYEDVFRFMVHRTFQRPRDIIQFCIKLQNECVSTNELTYRSILNAEKEFSLWLLGEVENEIAPIIPDTESLYELLRLMGENHYSISDFKKRYASFSSKLKLSAEDLLKQLYSFGIIYNVGVKHGHIYEQFSVIRNDRSIFNRDLNIITHTGFYKGLHTSKFLKR